jgi:hypothetical protein
MSRSRIRAVPVLGLLAGLTLVGCSFGMFFPSSIDVELTEDTPLRGPATEIRRIAVALPSAVEATLSLSDPSRGKLDRVALDIAERLEESGQFKIVLADEFRSALAAQRPEADSLRVSLTEPDPWAGILKAARQVGAEAVLTFEGHWESPLTLGDIRFGRPEFKRHVAMMLVDAATGQTIWFQKATAEVSEGIALPQEPSIRRAVARVLTRDFLRTIK